MDIMELGAIGEMIGGVAVIATLIYLAVQVRHGNQVEKSETHRAFVSDWNRQVLMPFSDAESGPFLRRANADFDGLSDDDKFRAMGFWAMQVFLTEELFFLHRAGTVQQSLWDAALFRMAALLQMAGPARWWEFTETVFSTEFVGHINTEMTRADGPPAIHEVMPWFAPTKKTPQEEA